MVLEHGFHATRAQAAAYNNSKQIHWSADQPETVIFVTRCKMTIPSQPSNPTPLPPPPYMFRETSTTAIISLIFGILSYLFIPLIGAIVAVVLGTMARREIAASNGRLTGDGLAQAGLILGWIQITVILLVAAAVVGMLILGISAFGHTVSSGGMSYLLASGLI
jgi:hypothetical protein